MPGSPPTAYPLAWPLGWPRTMPAKRETSKFRTTIAASLANVQDEVRRLGAKITVISANVTLGVARPEDPGIAVYFTYDGEDACIPVDRWRLPEENLQAVAKTIEAMRGIERWGAKHMIKAAFRGFAALPPPEAQTWRATLALAPAATLAEAEAAYRAKARTIHPDVGGSDAAMAALNAAIAEARRVLS